MFIRSSLLAACLLIAGCSSNVTLPPVVAPADMTANCPALPSLSGPPTLGTLFDYTTNLTTLYHQCAARHAALVDFTRGASK